MISFIAAMFATAFTFWNLKDFSDIFWMIPLMGFCQLSLFGGYAIYLARTVPDASTQHRHVLLLQRWPLRGCHRTAVARPADQPRLRGSSQSRCVMPA